jgi:hypothetical protein
MSKTYEIPESKLVGLQYRANKLAVRARNHGLFEPTIKVLETYPKTIEVRDPLALIRGHKTDTKRIGLMIARVEPTGFNPQLGAWDIVGYRYSIQADGANPLETGKIPDHSRGHDLCCEHCGYKRKRKETLIVQRSTDGAMVEVGSSCLSDFTGADFNDGFLKTLSDAGRLLAEIEAASRWSFDDPTLSLQEEMRNVLAVANSIVREHGYRNSRDATVQNLPSTYALVSAELTRLNDQDIDPTTIFVMPTDFMVADEIVAHFANKTDYNHGFIENVQKCIERGLASPKDIALLSAAVGSYLKDKEKERTNSEFESVVNASRPLGDKGDKLTQRVYVAKVKNVDSQWGNYSIISFVDDNDNLLVWKTSAQHNLVVNDRYEISGRIKDHEVCKYPPFPNANQTILSNVKVKDHFGPRQSKDDVAISDSLSEELDKFYGI